MHYFHVLLLICVMSGFSTSKHCSHNIFVQDERVNPSSPCTRILVCSPLCTAQSRPLYSRGRSSSWTSKPNPSTPNHKPQIPPPLKETSHNIIHVYYSGFCGVSSIFLENSQGKQQLKWWFTPIWCGEEDTELQHTSHLRLYLNLSPLFQAYDFFSTL